MWPFGGKSKTKAVIFDIGGVLLDADLERYLVYGADIFGCRPEQLQECARPFVVDLEIGRISSLDFWEGVGGAVEQRGWGRAVPRQKFTGFWKGLLRDSVKINQAVVDLVGRLRRRAALAALSNTFDEHAAYFEKMNVYKLFPVCILSFQVGMRKPDAPIYKLTASKLKLSPARCLFVDDSEANVAGARAVGMSAHHFTGVEALEGELRTHQLL